MVAGGYVHVCDVAQGGMGRVELVLRREGGTDRLYALKRLHDVYADDRDVHLMLMDEARLAGLLRHPHVVSVLDVAEDEDGIFLVMDWVDGLSLREIGRDLRKRKEAMDVQLAVRIVGQVADGLHAAHELTDAEGRPLRLVHRDVSPANVLVGFDGVSRVTDFGIAKAQGRATRTATGIVKGKLGYQSPEQLRHVELDRRSDLFSLGIVLYELVAGVHPYGRTAADRARRIHRADLPADLTETRPDVPIELALLVSEMLASDPDLRPNDARTLARRLERIAAALAAEEGEHRVSDWMERSFGAIRAEREASVRRALRTLSDPPKLRGEPDPEPGAREEPRRRAPLLLALAIATAAAVIVAASAWVLSGG